MCQRVLIAMAFASRPASDRRRADHRARRHHAGPHHRTDRRDAAATTDGVDLHHPRSAARGADLRRHRGALCRPAGRIRSGAARVRRAGASLYALPAAGQSADERAAPRASMRCRSACPALERAEPSLAAPSRRAVRARRTIARASCRPSSRSRSAHVAACLHSGSTAGIVAARSGGERDRACRHAAARPCDGLSKTFVTHRGLFGESAVAAVKNVSFDAA